jgi:putative SbcD/Mre11-related phosphoesterase
MIKMSSDKKHFLEIVPNIFIVDLFLYLKKHKALIISDLHIGFEESLNSSGIMLSKTNYSELKSRIIKTIKIIGESNIKKIIINGDLMHTFGKRSRSEKDSINDILKFLRVYGELLVIRGNHDKGISFITESIEEVIQDDILITHGDIINSNTTDKNIKTIIIGHEHPAIALSHGVRIEKYKCFLSGLYEKRSLIVMPSANVMIEGTDILKEKVLSPYLKKGLKEFEIFIIEDQIYSFGKVKKFL